MPTVVPTDSRPLSCPPIGALPRNRLASSATGSASPISPTTRFAVPLVTPSVGADAHIGPPIGTSCYAFVGAGVPDGPLCCTPCNPLRRGRCPHRPARPCPALLVALTPPVICRTSCHPVIAKPVTDVTGCGNPRPLAKNMSLRDQFANRLWQSAPPSPRPPCLRGAGTAKP